MSQDGWRMATNVVNSKSRLRFMITTPEKSEDTVFENRRKSLIASEASYVYILSGQKFIKYAKKGPFWRVFENLKVAVKQCYQTGQS